MRTSIHTCIYMHVHYHTTTLSTWELKHEQIKLPLGWQVLKSMWTMFSNPTTVSVNGYHYEGGDMEGTKTDTWNICRNDEMVLNWKHIQKNSFAVSHLCVHASLHFWAFPVATTARRPCCNHTNTIVPPRGALLKPNTHMNITGLDAFFEAEPKKGHGQDTAALGGLRLLRVVIGYWRVLDATEVKRR